MKRLLFTLLAILAMTGPAPPGHSAERGAHDAAIASAAQGDQGPVTDGLGGGYAAFGCGLFSRALSAGAVHVGVIAEAVATCAYMFFDAFFGP